MCFGRGRAGFLCFGPHRASSRRGAPAPVRTAIVPGRLLAADEAFTVAALELGRSVVHASTQPGGSANPGLVRETLARLIREEL